MSPGSPSGQRSDMWCTGSPRACIAFAKRGDTFVVEEESFETRCAQRLRGFLFRPSSFEFDRRLDLTDRDLHPTRDGFCVPDPRRDTDREDALCVWLSRSLQGAQRNGTDRRIRFLILPSGHQRRAASKLRSKSSSSA